MVPALEEEGPLMLEEEAGEGNVRKEKKEKHKKDKKHKHKHKHKSGHKRHRDDEDAAEVENVHAAVKPHSAEPETRANGKATHDVADKGGSDCESGEIPTAEDDRGEALESTPAGTSAEASRTTGRSLEAAEQQSNGGSTRPQNADAETSAVHKRARIESENNGVSEAAPIHPDCRPVEEPSSKDDEQAGNGKTLSSVLNKLKDSENDKGKHRDRHEEDRRRDDRRAHASKERRPEGPRDRRRDRSADRRREPERREPERSEHSARDARGRPASYRDARDRPVRDQGRDVRDGDRGFRLQGRDADPRARRYNNDRDRGYRPPSRDRERERQLGRERERGRPHSQYSGRGREWERDRGRDDRRQREPEPRKTKEELEAEAKKEAELAKQMEAALEGDEDEEQRLIEERRRRRQQILAKHHQDKEFSERVAAPTASELQSNGFLDTPGRAPGDTPGRTQGITSGASPSILSGPGAASSRGVSPAPGSAAATPARMADDELPSPAPASQHEKPGSDLDDDEEDVTHIEQGEDLWQTRCDEEAMARGPGDAMAGGAEAGEGPLAADADDPAVADSDDEKKHKLEAQAARNHDALDIFADQIDDDMFGPGTTAPAGGGAVKKGLLDNYDDVEGYYNFQVGEIMDERYEVFDTLGKGVFSTVLRARDTAHKNALGKHPEVAVKVIRSNDVMYKAGQTEMVILRKLSGADPAGKRHCVRMLRSFEYRQHLCLVFENMDLNLRELTKKYGRGIGLNIRAVRPYAAQMFWALHHLRNCGVLHSDIKPDNILVSEDRTSVKLCDFGSAMFQGENEVTPYLVSRYYRSPEVILGLKYDTPMDMWSIGCVLYELYTGKILFPGRSNNEMLKLVMDVQGPFPKKMLRKGAFADRHFDLADPNCPFFHIEEDPVTRQPVRRVIANPMAKRKFPALLAGSEGDKRQVAQLADLLERMMHLDPDKRITPKEALRHPFIKDSASSASKRS